jgi:uncharacterized membrane protein YphA (DoxX/SURF4 family)
MNRRNAAYWTTTVLAALPFFGGGVAYLLRVDEAVQNLRGLGYPDYLLTILGAAKVLAAAAIALPRFPRLKEWAYAGIAFNLIGAALTHAAVGHPAAKNVAPLVLLGVAIASWALRPPSRTLWPIDAIGSPGESRGRGAHDYQGFQNTE